jgi:hypothetical protein
VVDLTGLGLRHVYTPAIRAMKKVVDQSENNYPDRLKRAFIINAPSLFPRIWNLVKNFFDPGTRDKISILGADYYPELAKYIPEENIPAFLGGKSVVDGDIYCRPEVHPAGMVPPHLQSPYFGDDDDDDQEKTVHVKAGTTVIRVIEGWIFFFFFSFFFFSILTFFSLSFPDVVLESETLKWSFRTESKDIGFQVSLVQQYDLLFFCLFCLRLILPFFFSSRDGSEKEVVENSKVASGDTFIEGELFITEPGKYVLRWDNSFSWMTSKNLTFQVQRKETHPSTGSLPA